jgi:diamine N-acetyltransferase
MDFILAQNKIDFEVIETLARIIWAEHYTPIIAKTQVDYMLKKFQSKEAIAKQVMNEGYLYYIIRNNNKNIGYIGIQLRDNELFLSKIYILSSVRGKGYAKEGMRFIEKIARDKKLNNITLTVNKKNLNSIQAYNKMGFKCVDAIIQDIGNGFVMDDYKMTKPVVK